MLRLVILDENGKEFGLKQLTDTGLYSIITEARQLIDDAQRLHDKMFDPQEPTDDDATDEDGVRLAYTRMLEEEGCPECQGDETVDTLVCISGYADNLEACLCNDCGHHEFKYVEEELDNEDRDRRRGCYGPEYKGEKF